jgi:hypothetical protein
VLTAAAAGGSRNEAGSQPFVANGDEHGTIVMTPSQYQQLQQQLREQQQLQGASRITSAISNVTAELHLQRISKYTSAGVPLSTSARGSVKGISPRPSGTDEGLEAQQQQPQQQQQRSGVSEIQPGSVGSGPSPGADSRPVSDPRSPQQQQQLQLQLRSSSRQNLLRSQSQVSQAQSVGRGGSGDSGGLLTSSKQLQLMEVIGAGSFGVVYRASWR